jgi:hypothetical protein
LSRQFFVSAARSAAGLGSKLLVAAALIVLKGPAAHAQSAGADTAEQRGQSVARTVMALLSYVRWPAPPPELRLCIVGPTQYADELLQVQGPATDRKIVGRRLNIGSPLLYSACDVIYTGALDAGVERDLYAQLAGHPVLSISEAEPECTAGPMFCLSVTDQHVSFKINLDSVARSGVRVHPSVLQLGRAKAAGQ